MTFNITVPNAGQSPGVFPAQCNTNFSRLEAIISGDHVFNNTASVTDGVHKQMTMIARADPGSLPAGTNGILYNNVVAALGTAEVFYYNGTTVVQMSPPDYVSTINLSGKTPGTIASGATYTLATLAYNWAGSGYAYLAANYSYYNTYKYFGNAVMNRLATANPTTSAPTLSLSGNDIIIKNNSGSPQQLFWSLAINRIY